MDGNHHDAIGVSLSVAVGAIASSFSTQIGTSIAVGGILGTLYLSPDLDCRGSHRCKAFHRWKRLGLGFYWKLYAVTIPHHRHWLSHSVFVGTVYRLFWLLSPMAIVFFSSARIMFLQMEAEQLTEIALFSTSLYAGVELSTIIHLWVDSFPSK